MKLKNARTCNGCRALYRLQGVLTCQLDGFECRREGLAKFTPVRPCPKPETQAELVTAERETIGGAGEWQPNPNLRMSADEQRAHNQRHGFLPCDGAGESNG